MQDFQQWFDFIEKANNILKQGQNIDAFASNIQIIYEPSFDDHIFLQLAWKDKIVKWYRTTWRKKDDYPKIANPIESIKYIGKDISPTLSYEKGEISISRIIDIIEFARKISVKPIIDKYGGITLDGCDYTVILGAENFQTVYKWHSETEQWKDLQVIANLLYDLNSKLSV